MCQFWPVLMNFMLYFCQILSILCHFLCPDASIWKELLTNFDFFFTQIDADAGCHVIYRKKIFFDA